MDLSHALSLFLPDHKMINTNIFADGKPLPIVLRQACILSDKARRNLSKGHIVNLMSTDIETFYTVRIQSILNSFVSMNSSLQFTHPQADRQTDRHTHTHTYTYTYREREVCEFRSYLYHVHVSTLQEHPQM